MNRRTQILSPSSYLKKSRWLFEESKESKWTVEENKLFEKALALFDKDTPDRWYNVAAMIPGKTMGDVIKQYRELEEDVKDIEAGLIPISGYTTNSFILELVNNQGSDGIKQFYGQIGKRSSSSRPSDQERRKGVPWTEKEHRQFLLGLKKYGKGDWRNISRNFVTTRTPTQVASHAQKYYIRQLSVGKDKRRSSIHDITDAHSTSADRKPHSKDQFSMNAKQHQNRQSNMNNTVKSLYDWNLPNTESTIPFDVPNSSLIMAAPYGSSSYGLKLQEQNQHSNSVHGLQFGAYNSIFSKQSMQYW